eukprot:3869492-Pleurochrysis_carterae.AAC.2
MPGLSAHSARGALCSVLRAARECRKPAWAPAASRWAPPLAVFLLLSVRELQGSIVSPSSCFGAQVAQQLGRALMGAGLTDRAIDNLGAALDANIETLRSRMSSSARDLAPRSESGSEAAAEGGAAAEASADVDTATPVALAQSADAPCAAAAATTALSTTNKERTPTSGQKEVSGAAVEEARGDMGQEDEPTAAATAGATAAANAPNAPSAANGPIAPSAADGPIAAGSAEHVAALHLLNMLLETFLAKGAFKQGAWLPRHSARARASEVIVET